MIQDNKLSIFENFQIDTHLKPDTLNSINGNFVTSNDFTGAFTSEKITLFDYYTYRIKQSNKFSDFLKLAFVSIFMRNKKVKKLKKKNKLKKFGSISITDFFKDIFSSMNNIDIGKGIIEHYNTILANAEKTGQVSLLEIINRKINLIKKETLLLDKQITTYLSEEQIVKFYSNFKQANDETDVDPTKVLKLTWIRNYARVIPNEVITTKLKIDNYKVFDNYVVLHFDPIGDSVKLTEEEMEKAKDPILFGVISNSRKLYYIADWIDEHCDITLESFLENIQDKSFKITNNSVKSVYKDK